MKKNEEKMSEEYLKDEQQLVDRKSYESPSLIDLGKMKRVTLFTKESSGLDSEAKHEQ